MKRSVKQARVKSEPFLIWNAFVDLLAVEEYGRLSPIQQVAHLVFWYDSEVQNGGHGQYFENRGTEIIPETIDALTNLGLSCQAEILSRAAAALSASGCEVAWEYALTDSFIEELDAAFYDCSPTVMEALERHLLMHTAEYVELI